MFSVSNPVNRLVGTLAVAGLVALLVIILATAALGDIGFLSSPIGEPPRIERVVAQPTFYRGRTARVTVQIAPKPASRPAPHTHAGGSVWDRLAQCESGGNWGYNGSSGFDGGLQFLPSTWRAAGGTKYAPYAYQASREQQIAVAKSWLARTSWSQWPACSRRLGLR